MARPRKLAGTAVDKRNGQRADVGVSGAAVERFDPPAAISGPARAAYEDFWSDRPALLLTPSSRVVLLRWIDALDRYLRASAAADAEPLVTGSTGQQVLNPLYKLAESARGVMESCERQLGIGGLNAAALGIAAITERRSLQQLNAEFTGAAEAPTDDPRLR